MSKMKIFKFCLLLLFTCVALAVWLLGVSAHAQESVVRAQKLPSTNATYNTHWAFGLGMESRLDTEVNPDYTDLQNAGLVYLRGQWRRYGLQLELGGGEKRRTSSGSLRIETVSYSGALWGRYDLMGTRRRSAMPFLELGGGTFADQITTEFQGARDERQGRRGFVGLGLGVGFVLFRHLEIEAGARGQSIQQRKDPLVSLLIRMGVRI